MSQNNCTDKEEVNKMVSSVSSIGYFANSIFDLQSSMQSDKTTAGRSFDELMTSGAISKNSEDSSSDTISTMMNSSGSTSNSGSKSEMDLNQDGQVTTDEVIRYMQMQMVNKMSEQTSAENGANEMSQQTQHAQGIEDFKNQQAARAYKSSEQLLNSMTEMITESFVA